MFRLISERTVEENILKKANQKRMLGDMAIEGGNFTTAFFKQVSCSRGCSVKGTRLSRAVLVSVWISSVIHVCMINSPTLKHVGGCSMHN